jgi:predicted dehydrogenase
MPPPLRYALPRWPAGAICRQPGGSERIEFSAVGSRGDLFVDSAFDYQGERRHLLTVDGKTEERRFPRQDQFAPKLVYFSRCVRHDTDPEPDGREGLADVRVLVAIAQAATSGRSVKLATLPRTRRPG